MDHWTISLMMACTLAVFATWSGVYSQQPMLMMAEVDIAAVDSAGHHLHFDMDSPLDGELCSFADAAPLLFPAWSHGPINSNVNKKVERIKEKPSDNRL
jgi:hypothetical protein